MQNTACPSLYLYATKQLPLATLLARDLAPIIDGHVLSVGQLDAPVLDIVIDSRPAHLPANAVFFALVGPQNDGHVFITQCYNKGIRIFIVNAGHALPDLVEDAWVIACDDTLAALQRLARWHRTLFSYPVIAITGSNGKTAVKELLAQMLSANAPVVKSPLSYNSQVGVALSVWRMQAQHHFAVIEAGISKPGEMDKLEAMIRPTIGIFTHLGAAHDQGFASRKQKFDEKVSLFTNCDIVVSQQTDGPERAWMAEAALHYGFISLGWHATLSTPAVGLQTVTVSVMGKEHIWHIPTLGILPDNAINAAVAMLALGFDSDAIRDLLKDLQVVGMRLEWKEGLYNIRILDDTWNNDIDGLEVALQTMSSYQVEGQKTTLIITDMLETGLTDIVLYGRVARLATAQAVDRIIAIGPAIAAQAEFFPPKTLYFKTTDDAIDRLDIASLADNLVLVKGARRFGLERLVQRMEKNSHRTRLEVDLNALAANLNFYKSLVRPGVKIMAMVKAGAYGAGSFQIARMLQHHGVQYVAVAYPDEGAELRRNGITLPIAVMNIAEAEFDLARRYNLEPMVYTRGLLNAWAKYAHAHGLCIPIHLEINSGMNRLGLDGPDIAAASEIITKFGLQIASAFSHLAAADDPDQDSFTQGQYALFLQLADDLAQQTGQSFMRHIANTAGAYRFQHMQLDMVRLGIGLYGVEVGGMPLGALSPVAAWKTTVSQIRHVAAGASVSYGHQHVLEHDATIATLALGYADGLPRTLGNGAFAFTIAGRQALTIGAICMDMTMIDVTGMHVKEGDEAIIFDSNAGLDAIAHKEGTIAYEVLTRISDRVKRVYVSR